MILWFFNQINNNQITIFLVGNESLQVYKLKISSFCVDTLSTFHANHIVHTMIRVIKSHFVSLSQMCGVDQGALDRHVFRFARRQWRNFVVPINEGSTIITSPRRALPIISQTGKDRLVEGIVSVMTV